MLDVLRPHFCGDLFVGHMPREAIRAQQEPIPRHERLHEYVGLHAVRIADEAGDRAREHPGVIGGDPLDRAITHEVGAAIAEVSDDRVVPAHRRGDERRRGALLSALAGGAEHRVVGVAHRGGERVGARNLGARAEETCRERFDGGAARQLAAGLTPDAVRDGEQRPARLDAHQIAVLVHLPHATDVRPCGGPLPQS